MKITDAISQIRTDTKVGVKKNRGAEGAAATNAAAPADRVELSSGSRDVQKMKEILEQTPAMRMEMIETLKQQINEGTYRVDARDIADRMLLDDLLADDSLFYE
ncbi:MAG: flagellar biosynthesis anti-sigma factor FlgM [Thermodesulfobacteriota bacterium]